jgi:hypothetical protein
MNLESPKLPFKISARIIWLINRCEKLWKLMPDSIAKFEIIGKMLLFWLKGMPEIKLKWKKKLHQPK